MWLEFRDIVLIDAEEARGWFNEKPSQRVMDSLGPIFLYKEDKAELLIEPKTSYPSIDFGDKLVIPRTIHTTKTLDEFGLGQSFW